MWKNSLCTIISFGHIESWGERENKEKCKGFERESSVTCALNLTVGD